MPAPVDFAAIMRDFLNRLGPNADQIPLNLLSDPFDYTMVRDGKTKTKLPAGLRGKLASLHATEKEITGRHAKERGHTTQDWIGRRLANSSGHDSALRELDAKEQNELSQAREHWFRELPENQKVAFDAFCLSEVKNVLSPILPATLPRCLHGPIARLALEGARVLKTYNAKHSELQERHRSRGVNWTVTQCLVDRLFHNQQDALAQLEGRWLRELTQNQQDALDGFRPRTRTKRIRTPTKPKRRPIAKRKKATSPKYDGPRVILRGPNDPPTVNGNEKDRLTTAQYASVKALIEAGKQGLTKDELDRKSGRGDTRKILKRLAKKDADWKEVLQFAGQTGMRYRIL